MNEFNGLGMNLGNLSRFSRATTRSISAENPTGEKGKGAMAEPDPNGPARELSQGWKCRPCIRNISPGETVTLAAIDGSGAIQSMWFGGYVGRDFILRIYWDGQSQVSVECPLGDFFALPWVRPGEQGQSGSLVRVNSLPVCVNPNRGLNCFWEMPFRRHCLITLENIGPRDARTCFYQINYTLTDVPDDRAYFHAQFRRVNPLPYGQVYTIVDGTRGRGHYVGTSSVDCSVLMIPYLPPYPQGGVTGDCAHVGHHQLLHFATIGCIMETIRPEGGLTQCLFYTCAMSRTSYMPSCSAAPTHSAAR